MNRRYHEPIKTAIFPVKSGEIIEDGDIVGIKNGFIYKAVYANLATYESFAVVMDETASLDGVAKATTADGNVVGDRDNVGVKGDKTARLCLIDGVVECYLSTGVTNLEGKKAYVVDNVYVTQDSVTSNRYIGRFLRRLDTAGTRWLVKWDLNLT